MLSLLYFLLKWLNELFSLFILLYFDFEVGQGEFDAFITLPGNIKTDFVIDFLSC
jgi:hypothetical protein